MSLVVPLIRRIVPVVGLMLLGLGPEAIAEPRPISETSKDLGFGFREVRRSARNPRGSFEGIGHFAFLYYRDQELSQHGAYSIAPSGRYVVFQDGPTGDIVLFAAESRKRRVLQKYPGALVKRYSWSSGEREVVFEIEPIRVPIM